MEQDYTPIETNPQNSLCNGKQIANMENKEGLNPYSPKANWVKPIKKWHPVNYAGYWHIQDGEFYGDKDVLNAESVGEILAEQNAILAASAPELLRQIEEQKKEIDRIKEENKEFKDMAEKAVGMYYQATKEIEEFKKDNSRGKKTI